MSKAETLHELYLQYKNINFDESFDLLKEAEDKEEEEFFRMVTDFVLELYDNSEHFVRTARIENSVCVDKIIKCPLWVEELLYSANIIF